MSQSSAGSGRLYRELAALGRRAVAAGLVVGSGGNLSARLDGERCLVTVAGAWLDDLSPEDVTTVDLADGSTPGGGSVPSSELAVHLAAYRARPDVTAVAHLHPQVALLLDDLGYPIELRTTDHACYVRAIGRVPALPPGGAAVAAAVGTALTDGTDCLLLAGHGCVVVADSVELAARRALNLEEAARSTYRRLLLAGRSD